MQDRTTAGSAWAGRRATGTRRGSWRRSRSLLVEPRLQRARAPSPTSRRGGAGAVRDRGGHLQRLRAARSPSPSSGGRAVAAIRSSVMPGGLAAVRRGSAWRWRWPAVHGINTQAASDSAVARRPRIAVAGGLARAAAGRGRPTRADPRMAALRRARRSRTRRLVVVPGGRAPRGSWAPVGSSASERTGGVRRDRVAVRRRRSARRAAARGVRQQRADREWRRRAASTGSRASGARCRRGHVPAALGRETGPEVPQRVSTGTRVYLETARRDGHRRDGVARRWRSASMLGALWWRALRGPGAGRHGGRSLAATAVGGPRGRRLGLGDAGRHRVGVLQPAASRSRCPRIRAEPRRAASGLASVFGCLILTVAPALAWR